MHEHRSLPRREALRLLGAVAAAPLLPGIAQAAPSPAARLRELIEASEEAANRLDPMPRNPGSRSGAAFVDPLSDRYFDALERNAARDLKGLAGIDRAALPPVDQVAWDVFRYRAARQQQRFAAGIHDIARRLPLNATAGLHVQLPDWVAGGGASFANLDDYERGLERLEGFAGYLGSMVARLGQGMADGYLHSQVVARHVLGQVEPFTTMVVEQSPFYAAIGRMPASIGTGRRERLARAYREVIGRQVLPGYARLRDFLRDQYLPRATEVPGRVAVKDGDRLYADDLEQHTTLPLSAQALHDMGLAEVGRIRAGMESVRREVGFAGDLAAFFEHVRTDPRYYYTRPEELIARFEQIEARIWEGMPRLFARRPRAPFEVRPLPGVGGQRGTGYYRPGPPDGVSPGVLYFNMEMLGTRPIPTLETLTLHEGIPGHHYQITLVLEDARLPAILRFGSLTAYGEGWALYAESLGRDLGLFTDPMQWFGHLDMNMLRAVRLVVDTGLHAFGWSRQQAIDYMLANTSMARRDVEVEIDRYISWPGQACAYKPGELRIQALRRRAEQVLGARFDLREFHGQVLDTGSLPLAVLEDKLLRWMGAPA